MTENIKEEYKYSQVAGSEKEAEAAVGAAKAVYDAENGDVIIQSPTMSSSGSANRKFLYIAACAGNIASFTCGMAFGWTSPENPRLQDEDVSPLGYVASSEQLTWIGSLLPLGAAIGPFAAGLLADRIGRKKTLLSSVVPFIISFLMLGFGTNIHFFYIGRFLAGFAVGSTFTVLPMYIGEISDDEVRGSLGTFMQLFITLGLLFSYCLGPYIPLKAFNLICTTIPAAFLVFFTIFIPDSPYFLLQKGDEEEAEQALMKLRSKNKNGVKKELENIKATVEDTMANKATFMDIFKSKGLTKALIISVSLVSFQQFSGINIVLFYAQDIFTSAGSTLRGDISTIIIGVVQVISSCVGPALLEKKGKRFFLMISAVGMALSLAVLAVFFYLLKAKVDVSSVGWIPVVSLVSYIITYCLGFGPVPWAVMGELFPGNIKSAASTVTASGCWILAFLITKYFGLVSDLIGQSGSFGIFAICCVGAGFFVLKYVPETSGKSLQEIQDMLNGNEKLNKEDA